MRRRSRRVCVAKWAGTFTCAAILLAAAACLKWYTIGIGFAEGDFRISIHGGGVCFTWKDPRRTREPPPSHLLRGFFVIDNDYGWASIRTVWRISGILPRLGTTGLWYGGAIPLWIWFLAIGAPTLWLWRFDHHPKPGHCPCGYDMTGNQSGVCPECGSPS